MCNRCGEPIRWTETVNGRKMPVDVQAYRAFVLVESIEHGIRGRLVTWDQDGQRLDALASFFTGEEELPRAVYVEVFTSHLDTCVGRAAELRT